MLPAAVFLGFPCGSASKESTSNAGDLGWIHELGRSPREGKGYPTPLFWPVEFHGVYIIMYISCFSYIILISI